MPWTPPSHDRSVELRDHLSVSEWRVAIAGICSRHALDSQSLTPASSGSDVVWFAGDRVIKLTAPCWKEEIDAEIHWLTRVRGELSVDTPEVLDAGELQGWPYVVMSRVPGRALGSVLPELNRSDRLRLAADLGRMTRELHGIAIDDEVDDWSAFWRKCRSDVVRRHFRGDVPRELVDAIPPFLDSVGELESAARVLLHTEILDEHVLVRERDGRFELSALIDFADGRVGPPDYEFAALVEFIFRGEHGLLRAYLDAHGESVDALAPERSERMLAWALQHQFGSLSRMLRVVAPWRPATLSELAGRLYGLDDGTVGQAT